MSEHRDEDEMEFSRMTAYELLDAMDAMHPHKCPPTGWTLEQVHRYAGARQLIDDLLGARAAEIEAKADQ